MSDDRQPATPPERTALDARIWMLGYESGRKRGRAECPCGTNPGAEDLLTYEDGIRDGRAEDYAYRLRADAAIRCCETGHRPAYRKGRIAADVDALAELRRGIGIGRREGAVRALAGVLALAVLARWIGRPR